MEISVKTWVGSTVRITDDLTPQTTIRSIKAAVAAEVPVCPPEAQRLLFNDVELVEEDRTLEDYGVPAGATLSHIMPSVSPSPSSPSSSSYAARTDADGLLPLHWAARNGAVENIQLLLRLYPEGVKAKDHRGRLPLHLAAQASHPEAIRVLSQAWPEGVIVEDSDGSIPLEAAACVGHVEAVQLLLNLSKQYYASSAGPGVVPEGTLHQEINGNTAVHWAAYNGELDVVKVLCQAAPGCIKQIDKEGNLPLHAAAKHGHYDVIEYLLQLWPQGASIRNVEGEIPLFLVVRWGRTEECVMLLLQKFPDGLKMKNSTTGATPLHVAAEQGHKDLVGLLRQRWPEAEVEQDVNGKTPVQLAIGNGHKKVVKLFATPASTAAAPAV